jgi:hypothetical protein
MSDTVEIIRRLVKRVSEDEKHIGVLSTSEYLAVALVLNRMDLIEESRYPTMLEAANRIGAEWLEAALEVQRKGWD